MKRFILIVLIVSITAGIVFAQVAVPGNPLESPQSAATSGRIRSTADNFIRADSYVDVKFDKFYTMMGYENAPGSANLGYATKIKDAYLGIYYGGTLWANIPNITYTESNGTWLGTNKSGVKSYATLPDVTGGTAPSNNFSVLIGVKDMGFRVSVFTNKRLFTDSDFVSGGNSYKSYETESGVVTPQILWSMTKNLAANGIKPYVALDMAFTKNYAKENRYTNNGGSWTARGENVTQSDIYTNTTISAGLGGYTLLNKDNFRLSADLDYVLGFTIYDNEYNYNDSNGNSKIMTGFKGTVPTGGGTTGFNERSETRHKITPSLSGQWSDGPFAIRFKLNLNTPINETLSTEESLKGDGSGSTIKNGTDSKVVLVGFNPDFRLAVQWKIVPNLALNLGGRINFGTISSTTTDATTYTNNTENKDSSTKTVVTSNPTSVTNSLAMGVTYNATDYLTFEVASGASNGTINVFGNTGNTPNKALNEYGLLYFTNLLISIKY